MSKKVNISNKREVARFIKDYLIKKGVITIDIAKNNGQSYRSIFRNYTGTTPEKFLRKLEKKKINYSYKIKSEKPKLPGWIYYIGNLKHGYVKIGYSKNPIKRIGSIQTGCPFKLEIIYTERGSFEIEKAYQDGFKEYCTYGEWFKIEGDLQLHILSLLKIE